MVMKTYFKSALRTVKKQITRFFTIVFIVFVSIGLMSGIGELKNKVNYAVTEIYKQQNVADIIIKSKNQMGFSPEDITKVQNEFGKDNVLTGFSYDKKTDEKVIRIYSFDLSSKVNKLELLEGSLPKTDTEILVERKTDYLCEYNVGEKITLDIFDTGISTNYTVSGIVANPLIIHKAQEPSILENETLTDVIYLNNQPLPSNDIYISFEDKNIFDNGKSKDAFSSRYKSKINETKQKITENLGLTDIAVLSLYENFGLFSMHDYAEKVGDIALIFDLFFMLVTSLVIFSTMSRLLEEERAQVACLKTLGYSNFSIILKYVLFITAATIIGGIISLGVGIGLTNVLYISFNLLYKMPKYPASMPYTYFLISLGIILFVAIIVTILSGLKLTRTKPAKLLLAKTPPAGRKVLLERITPIWNKLPFKYKSSYRNVFLFRSRFLMTVISIIGSTILVLAGFGLLDNALSMDNTQSISLIAAALIVFAGLLCALVVYNITNINISERNREIATLMVLGYKDKEVTGYIFREVYIMSFIGAILGVPLGYGFLEFVFNLINFGSTSGVNWWTWILAPAVTMLFAVLSSMLLYRKVIKTDMNESLKTLD